MEGYFIGFNKDFTQDQHKFLYAVLGNKNNGTVPIYAALGQGGVLFRASERPNGKKLFRIEMVEGDSGLAYGHSMYAFNEKDEDTGIKEILIDGSFLTQGLKLTRSGGIQFMVGERMFSAGYQLFHESMDEETVQRSDQESTIEGLIDFLTPREK